ncbi:arginine--tRNA ligase [Candidatus Nitronereus thalassa]|uniref:Arginine--tRNA ligase n=1 Tax=Candidatus Nitronereus thalassa TaxID=3020898 RepID=A0ABU3KCC1_9BACT|nr:arginine--tRNA ligase [Candidatus Nitronereus thalassa]MDT7044165.1 arginine--tRNA ligase [Candidatus Nitronereus thalassa]
MSAGIVQEQVSSAISEALEKVKNQGLLNSESFPSPTVEFPKREEWGDLSSHVAMSIAKKEGKPPRAVADLLAEQLRTSCRIFEKIDIAPPGFLNFTLRRDCWHSVLTEIETQGECYGQSRIGQGRRVLLEFVSANPTGPLHMGHGRGAALGEALARLLRAAGYSVEREYYINDAGRQMKLLAASVHARYRELEGQKVDFPEDGYHGAYIKELAQDIQAQVGSTLLALSMEDAQARCGQLAYEKLLDAIKQDLSDFGINFETWYSEASLFTTGKIQDALKDLEQRDLVFKEDGAIWFRSSTFKDEKDRVVCKKDGDYTYLASDIAYHYDKLTRGFDWLINIWGADHHGYVPRMQGAVEAFGYPKDRLQVVLVQMVSLLRGGEKVEMSKRSGEFVTLREVAEEVGADAAKFFFLMRRSDTHLEFDLELAKKQSSENPVYYVQYAHARLASLSRIAQERGLTIPAVQNVDLSLLVAPEEFRLIKHLSSFPGLIESCAQALEPHRISFYLQELAGLLHAFYYKHRVLPPKDGDGQDDMIDTGAEGEPVEALREIVSPALTQARLALLQQVKTVLKNGLTLLGVSAPEKM